MLSKLRPPETQGSSRAKLGRMWLFCGGFEGYDGLDGPWTCPMLSKLANRKT
jgi:hypothetical protein